MSIGAAIVSQSPRARTQNCPALVPVSIRIATIVMLMTLAAWPAHVVEATPVPNTQASANFGKVVSLDGDYAVVGVPNEDSPSTNAGAAYVYRYSGSEWVVDGRLLAGDPAGSDTFGTSVAVSGDTIIVGSPGDDDNSLSASGSVYFFIRTINGWTQDAKLTAGDPGASDNFGTSVTIDGDVAVVGAPNWESGSSGSNAGAAYVFRRSSGTWSPEQRLEASDQAASDLFGGAIDIEGDSILIGAIGKDVSSYDSAGKAYFFEYASTTWSQVAAVTASDPSERLAFGQSVSLSGRAAIGTPSANMISPPFSITGCGAVYMFAKSGSWAQTQKVFASDISASDGFGCSVSLDGNRLLVGSLFEDADGTNAGAAYVLDYASSTWSHTKKITRSDAASNDNFGSSVALDSDRAFIGAPNDDDGDYSGSPPTVSNAGSAYFRGKDIGSTNNWGQEQKVLAEILPPGRCCELDGESIECRVANEYSCLQDLSVWNEGLDCGSGCTACAAGEEGGARRWGAGMPVGFFSQVNLYTGRVLTTLPVVGWSGRGPSVGFALYHNAACGEGPAHGDWTHSYSTHLEFGSGEITLVSPDGTRDVFTDDTMGGYDSPPGVFDRLEPEVSPNTGYRLTSKSLNVARFDSSGRLDWISDASIDPMDPTNPLNKVTLTYISGGAADGKLDYVTDASGRVLDLEYNTHGLLAEIIAVFGVTNYPLVNDSTATRSWFLLYDDGSDPSDPQSTEDGDFLALKDPLAHEINVTYTADGELETVENQNGHAHTFEYVGGRLVRVTGPTSLVETFSYSQGSDHTRARYVDVRGESWTIEFDAIGNVIRNIDPLMNEQLYFYEESSPALAHEVTSVENALGKTWTVTHDANGNVLTSTDPLGNKSTFEYDTTGGLNNLTKIIPPGATPGTGNTAKQVLIGYNDASHPTSATDMTEPADGEGNAAAATYIAYYANDEATGDGIDPEDWTGLLKTVSDTNGVLTTYLYDEWGQQTKETENSVDSMYDTKPAWPMVFQGIQRNAGGAMIGASSSHRRSPNCGQTSTTRICVDDGGHSVCSMCPELTTMICPIEETGVNATFSAGCVSNNFSANGEPLTADRCSTDPLMPTDYVSSHRNAIMDYDPLGRLLSSELTTNEPTNIPYISQPTDDVVRSFTNAFDDDDGIYTTTDQDGDTVVVETDLLSRTKAVTRAVGLTPYTREITAEYTYDDAGRVTRIDQGNGNWTERAYDDANRLTRMTHKKVGGTKLLEQIYDWTADGLIEGITEKDTATAPGYEIVATLTYAYDNRNRLIRETRVDDNDGSAVAEVEFDIEYTYDQGGNRLTKVEHHTAFTTTYTYDVQIADDGDGYQHNNRLLYQETDDGEGVTERRWYQYDSIGNLYKLIRNTGLEQEEAFWFYYDTSGKLWMSVYGIADYDDVEQELDNITLISAGEYRYDGGRQRYMVRLRDPNNDYEVVGNAQWRDYLGEDVHRDYTVAPSTGTVTNADSYLAGVGYDDADTNDPKYIYGDQIGTTRRISDSDTTPALLQRRISTSFGEAVSTVNAGGFDHPRYGYVGAYGYEEPRSGDPLELLGWLHVGERYYAPELGRFVQRDPIGIKGGLNTYAYVLSRPTFNIDPMGLDSIQPVDLAAGWMALFKQSPIARCWIAARLGWKTGNYLVDNTPIEDWLGWLIHWHTDPAGPGQNWHAAMEELARRGVPIPTCFVEGTHVATPDGECTIESISIGDVLLTYSETSKEVTTKGNVSQLFVSLASDLIHIHLSEEIITCTPHHPFWVVEKGWMEACQLENGDFLVNANGEAIELVDVKYEHLIDKVKVYNLSAEPAHSYFVGKSRLLVHNKQ